MVRRSKLNAPLVRGLPVARKAGRQRFGPAENLIQFRAEPAGQVDRDGRGADGHYVPSLHRVP
jgi:hypothetical protein